jgi:hypothetical protein
LSSQLSVAQILASLEAEMALHLDREAHHAQQEEFHREQRAVHAAEYATVAKNYEAFKATAGIAAEVAARFVAASSPPPKEKPKPVKKSLPSRLVTRWVEEVPAGQVFSSSQVAQEVNERYGRELRKPLDSRLTSTALRRLAFQGYLRVVQKGTAHREATYTVVEEA